MHSTEVAVVTSRHQLQLVAHRAQTMQPVVVAEAVDCCVAAVGFSDACVAEIATTDVVLQLAIAAAMLLQHLHHVPHRSPAAAVTTLLTVVARETVADGFLVSCHDLATQVAVNAETIQPIVVVTLHQLPAVVATTLRLVVAEADDH